MTAIICLAEKDYWNGVSALLNSCIKNAFQGTIYVGYRGPLPAWLDQQLKALGPKTYAIHNDLQLQLVELDTHRHLGFEKAFFISEVLKNTNIEQLFYFDTDCLPIADYGFYLNWTKHHIGVCMDECYTFVHENHPWKLAWREKLQNFGYPSIYQHPYINSGFLGLSKANFGLIEVWVKLTLALEKEGLDTRSFHKNPLLAIQGDQEILNMALSTIHHSAISVIGREGMGFSDPIYLMIHCTSSEKPWNKNFSLNFVKHGVSVSKREKYYFQYLNQEIKSLSKIKYFIQLIDLKIALILNRLF